MEHLNFLNSFFFFFIDSFHLLQSIHYLNFFPLPSDTNQTLSSFRPHQFDILKSFLAHNQITPPCPFTETLTQTYHSFLMPFLLIKIPKLPLPALCDFQTGHILLPMIVLNNLQRTGTDLGHITIRYWCQIGKDGNSSGRDGGRS